MISIYVEEENMLLKIYPGGSIQSGYEGKQIMIKLKLIAARAAAMASGSWDLTEICQIINYRGDKNTNLRSGGVCRS